MSTAARKEYDKLRRQRLLATGMCSSHPNSPVVPGKSCCQKCLDGFIQCNRNLKIILLNHYGWVCACCEMLLILEWATFDHINNDGAIQAQAKGKSHNPGAIRGIGTLNIRNGNFPTDLQTMCWNCNSAKGAYGKCPCSQFKGTNGHVKRQVHIQILQASVITSI